MRLGAAAVLVLLILQLESPTERVRRATETPAGRLALREVLDAYGRDRKAYDTLHAFKFSVETRFVERPDGSLELPEGQESFGEWLTKETRAYARDLPRVAGILEVVGRRLRGSSAARRLLTSFLSREDAPLLVYEGMVRNRFLPDRVRAGLGAYFTAADVEGIAISRIQRPAAERAASELMAGKPPVVDGFRDRRLLMKARTWAARIRGNDELHQAWREILRSPRALRVGAEPGQARALDLRKTILDRTPIGRCLVVHDRGSIEVNRHTVCELEQLIASLERTATERAPILAAAGRLAARIEDGPVRDAALTVGGRSLLAAIAEDVAAGKERPDAREVWLVEWFEPDEAGSPTIKPEKVEEAERLLTRAAAAQREIELDHARVKIALTDLPYDLGRVDLFRSSAFYNPRTRAGAYWYRTRFDDHFAARLFGVFGWTAKTTGSVEEFVAKLHARKAGLETIAGEHAKLIVILNTMPAWLSAGREKGSSEEGRRLHAEGHPPRDVETWKRLVRETARFFRQFDVERYYEFWNEPDLDQYWRAGPKEFLDLYEVTARTIREEDPDGKIGGAAVNQWDGKVRTEPDSDPLNLLLIRAAAKRKMPLDFVSWHHFGRPRSALREAREAFAAEARKVGLPKVPEFVVSEWTTPARGTPFAAAALAEMMVALRDADVDVQTIACWEEFHPLPDPKGFAPWGITTQLGQRKNTYHVHRFFDRLSRGSTGLAVVPGEEDAPSLVVSRKDDGVYEIVLWRKGLAPRVQAAIDALTDGGLTTRDLSAYKTYGLLEKAIRDERPVEPMETHTLAFKRARRVLLGHPVQQTRLVLELKGARRVEVLEAESVLMKQRAKQVEAIGPVLATDLDRYEVLRLLLRVH